MSTLRDLAALVRDLGAERSAAVLTIESLRQQRDALDTAPLPKSDLVQQLDVYVDAQLAVFDGNLRRALERIANRPNLNLQELAQGFPLLTMMDGAGAIDERLVVALLGAGAKKRCAAVVAAMDWPTAGPPASERAALREQLDAQIAAAQASLDEVDKALGEMGVTLEVGRGR